MTPTKFTHNCPTARWVCTTALTAAAWAAVLSPAQAQVAGNPPGREPSHSPPAEERAPQAPADSPQTPPAALTKTPTLTRFVPATLPPKAAPLTARQAVVLEFTITEAGRVQDPAIVTSLDAARDAAALAAARNFEFSPAELEGKPTAVRIRYEYVFEPTTGEDTLDSAPGEAASSEPALAEPTAVATGELSGRALRSGDRKPLVGATVEVPALGLSTLTDGDGRFRFSNVPAGTVDIVVSDSEHATLRETEEVRENFVTELTYYAQPTGFGEDDLVTVGKRGEKLVVQRQLSVRELNTVPGTNGDALDAVRNLPGVARTTGDQIVLRGESGARVFVNGHPVGSAFHFGGVRSTISNGLIHSLEVTPGNYAARYGNTNAGIVDIVTRRPADDDFHGYAEVNLFDTGLFLEGPVSENATVAIGGRRSYIDALLPLALSKDDLKVFTSAPKYYDFQGSYDWKKDQNRVRFNVLGSDDRLLLTIDEPLENDPEVRGEVGSATTWLTGQALWDYTAGDTRVASGVSYLWSNSSGGVGSVLHGEFLAHELTLRSDLTQEVAPWATLRTGLNLNFEHADFQATAPRGSEEATPPVLSGQPSATTDASGARYMPAAYGAMDFTVGPVVLSPALRAEHFSRTDELDGTTLLQPRINARVNVTKSTALKAGAGYYSRAPNITQVDGGFGNESLKPELSRQYSAGVEQRVGDYVSLDAVGFYKDLYEQVSVVDDPSIKYDNAGKGRAYGGEFLLKHDTSTRFYGWLAYTLMRSERRESGDSTYRVYDYDQTHNLTLVAQYRLTPTWELGARFRYVTGNPTTPVVGANYDSDADIYMPIEGAYNADRVSAFHQLDVRVDKHWVFNTWKLSAYLDIQNAYNRVNAQGTSYNFDYSESTPTAGANLPLIPSFGMKGEF